MRFFRSRIYLGLYDIVATRYRPFLFEGNRNGKIRRRKSANLASGITTVNFHYIYNGRWVSAVKWSRGLCYLLSTIKKKIIIIFAESFTLENFIFRIFSSSSRGNGIIYFFVLLMCFIVFIKFRRNRRISSLSLIIMWMNFLYFRRAISVSHSNSNFSTVSTIFTNYPIA